MSGISFLAILVLGVLLWDTRTRLKALERRLSDEASPPPIPSVAVPPAEAITAPAPPPRTVRIVDRRPEEPAPPAPVPAPVAAKASVSFESLVGGRLPIWIGGAALVLSAFFLVRYSIESGLIGPGVRVILGAVFGLVLLAASEAARRVPATASDPRVAQALAGAGVASLYGTLYMAAELYGLIGALPAFILMIGITAAALGLALRHGPPTAVMGLIGGFAAPLVTGVEAASIVPLLVYLALFTAGLFALAIHRGWIWLALAATGGGLLWPLILITTVQGEALGWVGLFVLALAVAGSIALPRAGAGHIGLRLTPIVVGLLQLLLIGPALAFSPLAWGLYGLLAAATIFLGWRDPALSIGAAAALACSLVLLAIGADQPHAFPATLAFAALFVGAGHAFARRMPDGPLWTAIALGGAAGPLIVYLMLATALPDRWLVCLIAAMAAACAALISVRFRDRASLDPRFDLGLAGGAAIAGLLAVIAVAQVADENVSAIVVAVAAAAIAAWAGGVKDGWTARAALPFVVVALIPGAAEIVPLIASALIGDPLPYRLLPALADALRDLAVPGLILAGAATLTRFAADPRTLRIMIAAAALSLVCAVYTLSKQPLHIDSDVRFATFGLLERALITQALLAAGFATLVVYPRFRPIGIALLALGAFRFLWFDLAVLNPITEAQSVGSIPILNLAVLHPAIAALWFWLVASRISDPRTPQVAALALVAVAVAGMVRQFVHGNVIAGADITLTENWLYSAVLLVLSLIWLWRGIAGEGRLLRLAGLGLLTLVTLKVFLIDAAALGGILRILSFLGLGVALIAIGWAYGRFLGRPAPVPH